jgi:hypothetical protein
MQGSIIKLDVGGTYYTTSRDTLCLDPASILYSMFSGQFGEPQKDPDTGRVFIDRLTVCNSCLLQEMERLSGTSSTT